MLSVSFFTIVTFGRLAFVAALSLSLRQGIRIFRHTKDPVVIAKSIFIAIWSAISAAAYVTVIAEGQSVLNSWQQPAIIYGVACVIFGWVWISMESVIWVPEHIKQIEKLRGVLPPHVMGKSDVRI